MGFLCALRRQLLSREPIKARQELLSGPPWEMSPDPREPAASGQHVSKEGEGGSSEERTGDWHGRARKMGGIHGDQPLRICFQFSF